jgi:hypothetical protein
LSKRSASLFSASCDCASSVISSEAPISFFCLGCDPVCIDLLVDLHLRLYSVHHRNSLRSQAGFYCTIDLHQTNMILYHRIPAVQFLGFGVAGNEEIEGRKKHQRGLPRVLCRQVQIRQGLAVILQVYTKVPSTNETKSQIGPSIDRTSGLKSIPS